ncbi:MAG: DUF5320 domain-containing protein, partial [Dokdonella sp.]
MRHRSFVGTTRRSATATINDWETPMKNTCVLAMAVVTSLAAHFAVAKEPDLNALQQQVAQLKEQLQAMEQKVNDAVADAARANQQVEVVKATVDQTNANASAANTNALNALNAPD